MARVEAELERVKAELARVQADRGPRQEMTPEREVEEHLAREHEEQEGLATQSAATQKRDKGKAVVRWTAGTNDKENTQAEASGSAPVPGSAHEGSGRPRRARNASKKLEEA